MAVETEYFLSATTFNVFSPPGENYVDPLVQAIQYSIAAGIDIVPGILHAFKSSKARHIEDYYQYGKNSHPYALPEGGYLDPQLNTTEAEVRALLANHFGQPEPDFEAISFGSSTGDYTEGLIIKLQQDADYNAYDQSVDISKLQNNFGLLLDIATADLPNRLAKILSVSAEAFVNQDPDNAFVLLFFRDRGYARIEVEITDTVAGTSYTETLTTAYIDEASKAVFTAVAPPHLANYPSLINGTFRETAQIYDFRVPLQDPETPARRWVYPINPDSRNFDYPGAIVNVSEVFHENYYPVVPFVVGGVYLTGNENDPFKELYAPSVKLMEKLGLSYGTFMDGLKQSPDAQFVTGAYIHHALSPWANSEAEVKYIWDFMESYAGTVEGDTPATDWLHEFYERDMADFQTQTSFNVLPKVYRTGQISYYAEEDYRYRYKKFGTPGEVGSYVIKRNRENIADSGSSTPIYRDTNNFIFQKQVSENEYEELYFSMNTVTHVRKGRWEIEEPRIPLDRSILTKYGPNDQELIVLAATVCTVTAVRKEEIEWYESDAFGQVLQFVQAIIIVITFVNFLSALASSSAEAGASSVGSNLLSTGQDFLVGALIKVIGEEIAKAIGGTLGAIVGAIFNVIAGAYATGGFNFSEFSFADLSLDSVFESGMKLIDAFNDYATSNLADQFAELQKEQEQFKLFVDKKEKEISDLLDKFPEPGQITQYMLGLMENDPIFGEDAESFYLRSLDTNPGVKLLRKPTLFANNHLQLPNIIRDPLGFDDFDIG